MLKRFMIMMSAIGTVLILFSCSSRDNKAPLITFPATARAVITFDENQIPGQCRVFSHLIITIPPKISEQEVTSSLEELAASHGADYLLIGLSRVNNDEADSFSYRAYGPRTPYSFQKKWDGWNFGFDDWNHGGSLINYDSSHLHGSEPAFDHTVEIQAVLLTCPTN